MEQEKLSKLPKWARDEFQKLQQENKKLKSENQVIMGNYTKSDTYALMSFPNKLYLPDFSRVVFNPKEGAEVMVSIHPDGYVRVEIDDGVIIPYARNVVYVTDRHNKINR